MTTSLISNNHLSEFRKAFELATNTIKSFGLKWAIGESPETKL